MASEDYPQKNTDPRFSDLNTLGKEFGITGAKLSNRLMKLGWIKKGYGTQGRIATDEAIANGYAVWSKGKYRWNIEFIKGLK